MATVGSDDIQYSLPHDTANASILPSKKRKHPANDDEDGKETKKKSGSRKRKDTTPRQQRLSKKKMKELQKILDKKKKKAGRHEVLEKLAQFQVTDTERQQYSSVARIGAKEKDEMHLKEEDKPTATRNSIAGSRRRRNPEPEIPKSGVSGVYFETDSSSGSDEDDVQESNDCQSTTAANIEKADVISEIDNQGNTIMEICTVPKAVPTPKFTSLDLSKSTPAMPTVYVPVYRSEETQTARLKLPILAEEQPIVEAIKEHPVIIICGETGSGKTTQVPQFLYEAGFCTDGRMIGITEPRRVAAISMSKRVAEEMNLDSTIVSYQIRYEGNVSEKTSIKFMTDGVLLKEIQKDFLLSKYSTIIIDEAHERSMYSDILIGLLSRIVPLRQKRGDRPLKLIIMSATLRIEDFTQRTLFRNSMPPVLQVESRQFPVTIYFNRITPENYLASAYNRVTEIHKTAPPDGGILVFVSGQREVTSLIRWLRRRFPIVKAGGQIEATSDHEEEERAALKRLKKMKKKQKKNRLTVKDLPSINLDSYQPLPATTTESIKKESFHDERELDLLESDVLDLGLFENDEEWELDELELGGQLRGQHNNPPLYCLPLYSLLPSDKQRRVFQPPPDGCRLCVVATNVAETSLTIPGIKYVVDTGKEKVRVYDGVAGVSKFMVQWISKASANQRAGRAGRTSAGYCYRLYSSAVFNDFETFSRPEIMNKPVDELVIQMKNMNILKVVNFPFPTAPERETLKAAEERLTRLGALNEMDGQLKITPLGRTIALFPVRPEFGKMLALGNQYDLLPYVICLVAVLSVREPMKIIAGSSTDDQEKKEFNDTMQLRRSWATGIGRQSQLMLLGDVSVLLRAMIEFEKQTGNLHQFCQRCGVRFDAMLEARKMRRQLTEIINRLVADLKLTWDSHLEPINERQALLLRQILLAGLGENVAVKVDADSVVTSNESEKKKLKKAYRTAKMKDFVYIHPNSVLCKTQPRYVVYQEVVETTRKYLHTVTAVESEWLPVYAQNYALDNFY